MNQLVQNDFDHWGNPIPNKHGKAHTFETWYIEQKYVEPKLNTISEAIGGQQPGRVYYKLKFKFKNRVSYNNRQA